MPNDGPPEVFAEMVEAAAIHLYCDGDKKWWDSAEEQTRDGFRATAHTCLQAAGVPALVGRVEELEAALDDELGNRDRYEEWADKLAYAIAPQSVIGEHSSINDPWENALDALDGERQQAAQKLDAARADADYLQDKWDAENARAIEAESQLASLVGEREQLKRERDDYLAGFGEYEFKFHEAEAQRDAALAVVAAYRHAMVISREYDEGDDEMEEAWRAAYLAHVAYDPTLATTTLPANTESDEK